jgi:deoxyhypusine monooxygenase
MSDSSDGKRVKELGELLMKKEDGMAARFRAMFTLRNEGGELALSQLARAFSDESALLKHEAAYVMGQMQDMRALPYLIEVLKNESEDAMVRHEAGEALGALGGDSALAVLRVYANDPVVEVAETCQLAVDYVEWKNAGGDAKEKAGKVCCNYESVDPAPPLFKKRGVAELRARLLDGTLPLFKRYRAMFALRNDESKEAVEALAAGFDDKSALFRHEIAYVLGQMMSPHAVDALADVLKRGVAEHAMVRHEAAEAIGAIATPESVPMLKQYAQDEVPAVAESCIVALDMIDYYSNDDRLEYTLDAKSAD